MRLDRWLKPTLAYSSVSRQIHKLARTGQLRVGGARSEGGDAARRRGSWCAFPPLDAPPSPPCGAGDGLTEDEIAFARSLVLHEDDARFWFSTSPPVSPSRAAPRPIGTSTACSAPSGKGPDRPRLVHRLDRDTSGVLALGKNRFIRPPLWLAEAFAGPGDGERPTGPLVAGVPEPPEGVDRPAFDQARRRGP